jgi:hypothetical protein
MEDADLIAMELTEQADKDLLANLSPEQLQSIRLRVLEGIAEIERGEFTEYNGKAGLKQLSDDIKVRGRERMSNPGPKNY